MTPSITNLRQMHIKTTVIPYLTVSEEPVSKRTNKQTKKQLSSPPMGTGCGGGSSQLLGVMAALRPLVEPKVFKKRTKKFIGHQSDRYVKLSATGRDPEALRARCAGDSRPDSVPYVGFGTNKKTKYKLPSGIWRLLVYKVKEHEVRLMCNKSPCAGTARDVSSKNCRAVVERAAQRPSASPTQRHTAQQTK